MLKFKPVISGTQPLTDKEVIINDTIELSQKIIIELVQLNLSTSKINHILTNLIQFNEKSEFLIFLSDTLKTSNISYFKSHYIDYLEMHLSKHFRWKFEVFDIHDIQNHDIFHATINKAI